MHNGTWLLISWSMMNLCNFSVYKTNDKRICFKTKIKKGEFKQLTANLMGGSQLTFPMILEWLDGRRFQVWSVSTNGHRAGLTGSLTTAAHTGVETESTFIQIRMRQSVNNVDPFFRIEDQHLAKEMDGLMCGLWRQSVQSGQWRRFSRTTDHVFTGSFACAWHIFHVGCAQEVCDQFQLLDGCLSLEKDPATKKFAKDAANRPDIDCWTVVTCAHQNFRCAVVLRHNFLRHGLVSVRLFHASQSEITYLQGEGE